MKKLFDKVKKMSSGEKALISVAACGMVFTAGIIANTLLRNGMEG